MDKLVALYVRGQLELQDAVKRLSEPREGQGLVEYILIIAVISLVIVAAGLAMRNEISAAFTAVTTALTNGVNNNAAP